MALTGLLPGWISGWFNEGMEANGLSPFAQYRQQTMVELPEFTITSILLNLDAKDIGRCSCVSKEWAFCAKQEPVLGRLESVRDRTQMEEKEKAKIDQRLLRAACCGRHEEVEKFIRRGADVNMRDPVERTPLIYAAILGYLPVVEVLIAKGSAVDAADRAGWTALMHAAKDGYASTVVALLCSGVNLQLRNLEGKTALEIAKQGGHNEVVKLLIEAGAEG